MVLVLASVKQHDLRNKFWMYLKVNCFRLSLVNKYIKCIEYLVVRLIIKHLISLNELLLYIVTNSLIKTKFGT